MKINILKINKLDSPVDFEFDKAFSIETIENELKPMQEIVDGCIEFVTICSNWTSKGSYSIDLVCNDEGKLLELPFRAEIDYDKDETYFDVICGECFLVLVNENTGETESLSKSDIEFIKEHVRYVVCVNNRTKEPYYLPSFYLDGFKGYEHKDDVET